VIGDEWRIAASVAAVLTAGALMAAAGLGTGGHLIAPLVGLAIAAGFAAVLIVDVRAKRE
jgi:hypothetical protein